MVIAQMVTCYTLLDEILSDLIVRYFFKQPKKRLHFGKLWRTKKFQTFNHHILDEMYLLKKMELVHAIDPLPSEVIKFIRKVNALRNAFAHSFFPENRKEHRKNKKVLYSGKDIHTHEVIGAFPERVALRLDLSCAACLWSVARRIETTKRRPIPYWGLCDFVAFQNLDD
jgi:hypothetical protein